MSFLKQLVVLYLVVSLVAGCATFQPVTGKPADVQRRIASGALLKRGDDVLITTQDGRLHYFKVTSVSASSIEGAREPISIDQIAFIQKRKLDVGKTALAVGLTVVVAAAVVVAAYSVKGSGSWSGRAAPHSTRIAQPVPSQLLLPTPSQNSRQGCDASSGESKGQDDGGESAHVRRCAR